MCLIVLFRGISTVHTYGDEVVEEATGVGLLLPDATGVVPLLPCSLDIGKGGFRSAHLELKFACGGSGGVYSWTTLVTLMPNVLRAADLYPKKRKSMGRGARFGCARDSRGEESANGMGVWRNWDGSLAAIGMGVWRHRDGSLALIKGRADLRAYYGTNKEEPKQGLSNISFLTPIL